MFLTEQPGRCWEPMSMSHAITDAPAQPEVTLPPAPRIPSLVQGLVFAVTRRGMMRRLARRYGNVFTLNIPIYGRVVVVGDPQLAGRCSPPVPTNWATSSRT
ncbi:cytochrome P450 domain protein [Mycobacterium kansasii]|uniref:Cytochrome P450 domain protein n=1 Tax=Mycobacterium kansasii TaxID=1768 RepID=A0A1V3WC36_MYCKA|nr:cytochrome P450 domain protein [Mycobacterium kansasii]